MRASISSPLPGGETVRSTAFEPVVVTTCASAAVPDDDTVPTGGSIAALPIELPDSGVKKRS